MIIIPNQERIEQFKKMEESGKYSEEELNEFLFGKNPDSQGKFNKRVLEGKERIIVE